MLYYIFKSIKVLMFEGFHKTEVGVSSKLTGFIILLPLLSSDCPQYMVSHTCVGCQGYVQQHPIERRW